MVQWWLPRLGDKLIRKMLHWQDSSWPNPRLGSHVRWSRPRWWLFGKILWTKPVQITLFFRMAEIHPNGNDFTTPTKHVPKFIGCHESAMHFLQFEFMFKYMFKYMFNILSLFYSINQSRDTRSWPPKNCGFDIDQFVFKRFRPKVGQN